MVSAYEVLDSIDPRLRQRGADRLHDIVPFLVRVFCDLVRDLAGEERETNRSVECRGREPVGLEPAGQPPVVGRLPETNVVPLACASADFLLNREVLLAAE